VLALVSLAVGLSLLLRRANVPQARTALLPGWDIPARMIVATTVVVTLTGLAPLFGPRLTGLFSRFPVYAGVVTVFAHRQQGPAAAANVLRGLLFGVFGFASFFFILAVLLVNIGLAPAFLIAIFTDLALQPATLWLIRRRSHRAR